MAWPLYALIVTGERGKLGPPIDRADKYMEGIVKGMTFRCYAYQAMILISGLLMAYLITQGFGVLLTNWLLATKSFLLLALVGLLSFVHLSIQPQIDTILQKGQLNPEEVTQLRTLRLKRRRMASLCLFSVLTSIILGVQVWTPFSPLITIGMIGAVGLFVWRAYVKLIPFGWI
ncbi:MAG: hypothetical protein HYY67_05280 [Thaumarchaeota archaeon]|nr:hypothetical protein [Nitrososphaerota archaeon]